MYSNSKTLTLKRRTILYSPELQDKEERLSTTLIIGVASPPLGLQKKLPKAAVLGRGGIKHAAVGQGGRLVFAATSADGDVAEGPTGRPVPLAAPAEVPRLINIVIVEVTKLGFHAFASGAWDYLLCRPLVIIIALPSSFIIFM